MLKYKISTKRSWLKSGFVFLLHLTLLLLLFATASSTLYLLALALLFFISIYNSYKAFTVQYILNLNEIGDVEIREIEAENIEPSATKPKVTGSDGVKISSEAKKIRGTLSKGSFYNSFVFFLLIKYDKTPTILTKVKRHKYFIVLFKDAISENELRLLARITRCLPYE